MPSPFQTVQDANGKPISGALITTYLAGTTTPVATYTDVGLTVANTNPIVADSSGRFTAFLTPGVSYKFVYTTAASVAIRTVDNIAATPTSSGNFDITGTAGEALTAGQAVYLSDGSGSKTAGNWYKADTSNPYSSTLPAIGMVPSSISSGSSGTIRIAGQVTGLSSLTIGADYFLSTSGAITSTLPTVVRYLGQADSATTLVLSANPRPNQPINQTIAQGRLTLTSGTAITTADVTAATTLYYTPYIGNQIALYDGTRWIVRTFSELSIAVPATTSQMYDVWLYDNAGTLTLELLAWTNDTTRATALTTQNGVYVKSGAATRRYLGSFRTTTVSGQTEDSVTKRYVWNYSNRVRRTLQRFESTASWTYTAATVRQANGAAANQVDLVIGVAEVALDLYLNTASNNSTAGTIQSAGIGEDTTTAYTVGAFRTSGGGTNDVVPFSPRLVKYPAVGRHYYAWNEYSVATGTTTWYGAYASGGSTITFGLVGSYEG